MHVQNDRIDQRADLAEAVMRLGCFDEAMTALRAKMTAGSTSEVWLAIGAGLLKRDDYHAAADAFRHALACKTDSLRALIGLGRALMERGRADEASECFARAIALDSGQPIPHRALSDARHMLGDLVAGWDEAEWHRPESGSAWREFEQPEWDGGVLDGRTMLLWNSRALGDTIQFLRYVPLVRARSAGRIILECPRQLLPLTRLMPSADNAITYGAPPLTFDVHDRVTRLPQVFRTALADIPNHVPYLYVEAARVERWRRKLARDRDERLTVGLSWGGNVANTTSNVRFASLRAFAPLTILARDVRLVSLQLGPQLAELRSPPPGLRVETFLDDRSSLADTAALIHSLDLVITVDTMIAHLAGAFARPTWIVLPQPAGWRWLMDTDVTPWYPTMRLFRQTRRGDWPELFTRVAVALEQAVSAGGLAAANARAGGLSPANAARDIAGPAATTPYTDHPDESAVAYAAHPDSPCQVG